MKRSLFWLFLLALPVFSNALDFEAIEKEAQEKAVIFVQGVKDKNVVNIAEVIQLPIAILPGIPPVMTPRELAERFDEIFDKELYFKIANSNPKKDWHHFRGGFGMFGGAITVNAAGELIIEATEGHKALAEKYKRLQEKPLGEKIKYGVKDGQFFTNEGAVPAACFAEFIISMNGDDIIASVFLNRSKIRGCITSNKVLSGNSKKHYYNIYAAQSDDTYFIEVCRSYFEIDGSRPDCSRPIIKFVNRDYISSSGMKKVLSVEKLGEW